MCDVPLLPGSDDEEDLDALRIAALQSLKRKEGPSETASATVQNNVFENSNNFRPHKGNRNKIGRFFAPYVGRGAKHSHFNRSRNANLISITTIPNEGNNEKNESATKDITVQNETNKDDSSSKFSRYDNSDKSESETDDEELRLSGEGTSCKLERTNSLEALMLQLDSEIQGKPVESKDQNVKTQRDRNKTSSSDKISSESDSHVKSDIDEKAKDSTGSTDNVPIIDGSAECENSVGNVHKFETHRLNDQRQFNLNRRKRMRPRSPSYRRNFQHHHHPHPTMFNEIPNNPPAHIMFGHPLPFQPPPHQFPNQQFNPYQPIIDMSSQLPPPFYNRPLSPLAINTNSITTATMAPLSPRSAAFVLQNKAIIERRRRSPRRSYSRSLSRSPRRSSISPRRSSMSPRRSPISPRRMSRSPPRSPRRRLSLSPRRKSLSPRRRSMSPRKKKIRNDAPQKNKLGVRERLGTKNAVTESKQSEIVKESGKTPADDNESSKNDESVKKEDKVLDPVLEARRKKFESNEIKKKEGIIRLKPKEERRDLLNSSVKPEPKTSTSKTVQLREDKEEKIEKIDKDENHRNVQTNKFDEKSKKRDGGTKTAERSLDVKGTEKPEADSSKCEKNIKEVELPDEFEELEKLLNDNPLPETDDIIQPKVADIFSDEDSGSDNEGRFKIAQKSGEKVPVIPFSKLGSRTGKDVASNLSLPSRPGRSNRHSSDNESRYRRRSKNPSSETRKSPKRTAIKDDIVKKHVSIEKAPVKNRITVKTDRYTPPIDRKFDKKIEIKIKNPKKYEKLEKSWNLAEESYERNDIKKGLDEIKDEETDEIEPEIVIENDSEDEENASTNEGDLRAQLSKKRAEKLHKIPVTEVSSRLLKNALEGAVFKKTKKKKSKEKKEIIKKDVRVPIHLRLGVANSSEIFSDATVKRQSRKRKNREVLEQV